MRATTSLCLCLFAVLSACSEPPRDPAGTTERIERTGAIVVGEIAGAPGSGRAEAALGRVAARLGAKVERRRGHGEDLLKKLEHGEIDLVYGHFAKTSPWATKVHLGSPLGRRAKVPAEAQVPRFVFRKGENGWIMRVEQEGRR